MADEKPLKVLCAIPSGSARLHAKLIQNLLPQISRADVEFAIMIGMSPVSRARNEIVKAFLADEAFTHLWMIDDDTIPPKDALDRLLAVGADIATGITPILRTGELTSNVYKLDGDKHVAYELDAEEIKNGKPFEIDACGTPCILISRRVIERFPNPDAVFMDIWDQNGSYLSEDLNFCREMREMGDVRMMVEPTVRCGHARYVVV